MHRFLILPLATLVLASCGGNASRRAETGPPVIIEVQNNNFQDATVWAIREGDRRRLGVVTGKTDASFEVPWMPNLNLRLEVRFLGGGACATRNMQMNPGELYVLELQPDIRLNIDCERVG